MKIVNVSKRVLALENAIERSCELYDRLLMNDFTSNEKLDAVEKLTDDLRTKRDALKQDVRGWIYDRSIPKKERMGRYNLLNLVNRNLK